MVLAFVVPACYTRGCREEGRAEPERGDRSELSVRVKEGRRRMASQGKKCRACDTEAALRREMERSLDERGAALEAERAAHEKTRALFDEERRAKDAALIKSLTAQAAEYEGRLEEARKRSQAEAKLEAAQSKSFAKHLAAIDLAHVICDRNQPGHPATDNPAAVELARLVLGRSPSTPAVTS